MEEREGKKKEMKGRKRGEKRKKEGNQRYLLEMKYYI